jgi:hypothetical protein
MNKPGQFPRHRVYWVELLTYSQLAPWKHFINIYCCLERISEMSRGTLTGSLWRRQSQQSFDTLTPFNFLFYSLHVSAPTGHPQVRYTISYLKDCFNTTDPLYVCNLIWGCYLLSSVFQLVVLIHVIKLSIKIIRIVKSVKFHVTSGVVSYKTVLYIKY